VAPAYGDDLAGVINSVIGDCVGAVHRFKNELKPGQSSTLSPSDFPDLQLKFSYLAEKLADSPTALTVVQYPVICKRNEALKYEDKVLSSLHQCRKGHPNVLVIWLHSVSYEPGPLEIALAQIRQQADEGNETFFQDKEFKGIQEFEDKLALLSTAIVMSGGGRNLVWANPKGPFLDERVLHDF
jgi:hypothetical protein